MVWPIGAIVIFGVLVVFCARYIRGDISVYDTYSRDRASNLYYITSRSAMAFGVLLVFTLILIVAANVSGTVPTGGTNKVEIEVSTIEKTNENDNVNVSFKAYDANGMPKMHNPTIDKDVTYKEIPEGEQSYAVINYMELPHWAFGAGIDDTSKYTIYTQRENMVVN